MRVLWNEGKVSARRITEAMSERAPISHSTVQTLLRQLEAKNAVGHEKFERTFLYRALIPEEAVGRSVARDILDRVFQGSISGLVAHLLDGEDVSEEEMSRLRNLLDSKSEDRS